jgi:hypothetical protein
MIKFDARLPADFPVLADQPIWLFLVLLLAAMGVIWTLNHFYFSWLHRRLPGLFQPRVLLAIFVLCVVVIAIGIATNPPSEVRKAMKQSQPK